MGTERQRREIVEQLAEEFVERYRRGERPPLSEYIEQHPEHATEIRELFPALVLMEQVAPGSDESAPSASPASPGAGRTQHSERLGDYQILREIGRGGMGVVYEAQQLSLGRHVAIKVLPSHSLLDPRQLGRFQREARSAARLHHTNIVPVFGVGEHDGLHYYVMQFIRGLGLDAVLHELRRLRPRGDKPAPTAGDPVGHPTHATPHVSAADVARGLLSGEFRQPDHASALTTVPEEPAAGAPAAIPAADTSATIRLPGQSETSTLTDSGGQYWQSVARVGMQVADALAHAAGQGVLHRDIKPSNLLLDETGNVWVTDFGLAKADSDEDNLTHTGDIVGTLRYMAPERFNGQGDLRSDVYSLGLTLYELLTLRPAFDESDRNKLVRRVMHDEPERPRKVNRAVPQDLETVVLKAIAREPAQRYQTPAEMAEDLKRFIEDRPVKARPISEWERLWRWCRRNPLPASLVAVIVLVFLIGFAGVSWQWREADTARKEEKSQRGQAEVARDDAKGREREAVAARDEAKQARNAAARQAAGLLLDRGIEDARGGEPARALHLFVQALRRLPADDPEAAPLERVIRANLAAWAETVPALEHIWPGGTQSTCLVMSPEGDRIAMTVGQDEVQCFRTDTGRPAGPPIKIPDGRTDTMVFSPDGRSLWVASPGGYHFEGKKWAIHRLDPASGRPLQKPIPTDGPVMNLAVTPNGRYLAGAVIGLHPRDSGAPLGNALRSRMRRTASIAVWETATGRAVRQVVVNAEHWFSFLGLSPDGKSVTAWVLRKSKASAHGGIFDSAHGGIFDGVTFTVDGNEPPIHLGLHPVGPRVPSTLQFQNHMRTALAIKDGQLHRWSVTNPSVLGDGVPTPFRFLHEGPAPDGRSVISRLDGRSFDSGAWLPRPSGVRFAHPGWQRGRFGELDREQYSLDGRFIATSSEVEGIDRRLWRLPRPHSRPTLPPTLFARQAERTDYHRFARFDPRATHAILWCRAAFAVDHDTLNVRVVDVATGAVRDTSVRHSAYVRDVVVTADGRYLATASNDGTARVWETATGRPAGPPLPHANYVATVAFGPDGKTLAAGDYGPHGLIKFWDWRTGKEVRSPLRHDDVILNVAFSPDGRYLAAVKARDWSRKPELLVWDVASGTPVLRVPHSTDQDFTNNKLGLRAQYRPDGRAVAARGDNGVLRLWEIPSGKLLGQKSLDGNGVARFSPDGRMVAASANLGVRLLDGATLDPLPGGYLPSPDPIDDVAFSPDGAFLLTAHRTWSAQLWDVAALKPIGPPAVLIGPIRAVKFSPTGKTCLCVAADGTVRRWPVLAPLAEPDLDRLADRVTLMTGQRMGDSQGLDSVPADEWRALRAKLVGEGSTALVPPRRDVEWHDAVAADAEQDRDTFGAEWHLDRLAALRPNDWTIPARRGRILAATGSRDEAGAAYARAARLAPSPQVLSDWLRASAADEEAAGRKEAALWNLDRALTLTPDDWTLYALRASLADPARAVSDLKEAVRRGAEPSIVVRAAERVAGSGNWKQIAALFNSLARSPAFSMQGRYLQVVANLKAGDAAGYRAACAGIAKGLAPVGTNLSPFDASNAAMAFALGPDATDDWAKPLAWIAHALARLNAAEKANPASKNELRRVRHAFLRTRGAVLYRAGRFEEAAKVLHEAMSHHAGGGEFHDWLFVGLTEHRLGHADAARAAASKARAAMARQAGVWDRAELELLAAELDAVLPPAGK